MTMIIMVMAVMLAKCCKVSEPMEPKKLGNMLLSQWASFIRKCPGYDRKLLSDIELITEEMCNT